MENLNTFLIKVNQENLLLSEDLIGGTQGNCHVSSSSYSVDGKSRSIDPNVN